MENAAVALTDGVDLNLQPGRRCQNGETGVRVSGVNRIFRRSRAVCAPQAWPF